LWKWRTKLAEYDFKIKYKKVTLNSNADALSRNPVETHLYPLIRINGEDSSDESLCSFNRQSTSNQTNLSLIPYNYNNNQANPPNNIPPDHNDYVEMAPLRNFGTTIEEIANSETFLTDSGSDSDKSDLYQEIIEPISVPYKKEPLIPKHKEVIIQETRESLLSRKDNHVIFIHLNGTPFDTGSEFTPKQTYYLSTKI